MVAGLTTGLGEIESARPGFELWKLGRFVRSKPALAAEVARMSAAEIDAALAKPRDADWKAFAKRFREFIGEFGYRGMSEADPSVPSWSEEHTFVVSVIKTNAMAGDDRDPRRHADAAVAARERLEAEILTQLRPGVRKQFRRLATLAQRYARNRERSKAAWVRGIRLSRPCSWRCRAGRWTGASSLGRTTSGTSRSRRWRTCSPDAASGSTGTA
jgi:hypothetical protein